jgi:hypothetical protein
LKHFAHALHETRKAAILKRINWALLGSSLIFYFVAIKDNRKSTMCAETYTRLGTGAPASNKAWICENLYFLDSYIMHSYYEIEMIFTVFKGGRVCCCALLNTLMHVSGLWVLVYKIDWNNINRKLHLLSKY